MSVRSQFRMAVLAATYIHLIPYAQAQSAKQDASPINRNNAEAAIDAAEIAPIMETDLVRRIISLGELGFDQGIEMDGLSGSRELFFPVPHAENADSLRLILPYRSASAFDSRRSLQVEIDNSPVFTTSLPSSVQSGTLEIPVDPASVRDDYLRVQLHYRGAISEDRCVDDRVSGAYLSFAPDGALVADLARDSFDSVARVAAIMPPALEVILPDVPNEAQAAAALTLTAGYQPARLVLSPVDRDVDSWTRSRIRIGDSHAPSLAVDTGTENPEIVLGGSDPASAARLLRSQWNLLATTAIVGTAQAEKPSRETLTFADLGGNTSVQRISDRGTWTVPLPTTALAAGKAPSGLVVDVAVSDDGSATDPVISVLMNGVLLGSAKAKRGGRTRLTIDIPDGLVAANNTVEVAVTRQVRSGDCAYSPQAYDAQLLPSSHVRLREAGEPVDFSDLGPVFAGGVTVVLPGPDALSGTRRLISTLLAGAAPIRVSYGGVPPTGAYVLVSETAPQGIEPAVRLGGTTVPFIGIDGRNLIDADAISQFTVAQLLSHDGRPALWIRPGTEFYADIADEDPVALGRGNVAFVRGNDVELAFSTQRDRLIDIRYPDEPNFTQLIKQYWLWLVIVGWLLASAGFVYLLRSIYQAGKTGD